MRLLLIFLPSIFMVAVAIPASLSPAFQIPSLNATEDMIQCHPDRPPGQYEHFGAQCDYAFRTLVHKYPWPSAYKFRRRPSASPFSVWVPIVEKTHWPCYARVSLTVGSSQASESFDTIDSKFRALFERCVRGYSRSGGGFLSWGTQGLFVELYKASSAQAPLEPANETTTQTQLVK